MHEIADIGSDSSSWGQWLDSSPFDTRPSRMWGCTHGFSIRSDFDGSHPELRDL